MAEVDESGYFAEKLAEYQNKLAEFNRVFDAVKKAEVSDPQLAAEREELLSRASWIRGALQKAENAINEVQQKVTQFSDVLNGNLGAIPLIAVGVAVAAMVGAIAYMSSFISDAYVWAQKAKVAESLREAGATPGDITAALSERSPWGTFALLAAVGVGLYMWQQNK